jgi:molybdopterin converting factor small subunit
MSQASPGPGAGAITVRYWAAARAAAGTDQDVLPADRDTTLAAVLDAVRERHPDRPRFAGVIAVCSVLVGDKPVGTADAEGVVVGPGDTVELLPPFAGG